jgi:hypothetical protein
MLQILAASSRLETLRGNLERAEAFRAQARPLMDFIAARTPAEYRARFVERALQSL